MLKGYSKKETGFKFNDEMEEDGGGRNRGESGSEEFAKASMTPGRSEDAND